tara:strand:+ start:65 stop:460 length:396 start_codon:yes stop_codon:yes gene_type:complete
MAVEEDQQSVGEGGGPGIHARPNFSDFEKPVIRTYQSASDDCTGLLPNAGSRMDKCKFDTALDAESRDAPADPISGPKASPMKEIPSLATTDPGPEEALLYRHLWDFQPSPEMPNLCVIILDNERLSWSIN